MLKMKARPLGVLIVEDCDGRDDFVHARIQENTISQAEKVALRFGQTLSTSRMRWWIRESGGADGGVDELVYTALSLGFTFRGEPDRARWKNREPFEMYREAVRELA